MSVRRRQVPVGTAFQPGPSPSPRPDSSQHLPSDMGRLADVWPARLGAVLPAAPPSSHLQAPKPPPRHSGPDPERAWSPVPGLLLQILQPPPSWPTAPRSLLPSALWSPPAWVLLPWDVGAPPPPRPAPPGPQAPPSAVPASLQPGIMFSSRSPSLLPRLPEGHFTTSLRLVQVTSGGFSRWL